MKLIRYQYPQAATSCQPTFNRSFGTRASPFYGLNSLFGELLSEAYSQNGRSADFFEDDQSYYVRFELPGVSRSALELELEDSVLEVRLGSGVDSDNEDDAESVTVRSLSVPEDVDEEAISARLEDGVFTVTLPKAASSEPRKIEVN